MMPMLRTLRPVLPTSTARSSATRSIARGNRAMTDMHHSTDTIAGGSSLLVSYGNQPAALVSLRRFSFLGEVRHLPPGDPVVRVVTYVAYYAQLVLGGELSGPYRDRDAERFAGFALIDPAEVRGRRD